MSRSCYSEDIDTWQLIRWRGAVASAINGKRGQAFLRELLEALDAMSVKELYTDDLKTDAGQYCTLGVLGEKRGVALSEIDPEDSDLVATTFGISDAMAREIMYQNDEADGYWTKDTPASRWTRMRDWVQQQIKPPEALAND